MAKDENVPRTNILTGDCYYRDRDRDADGEKGEKGTWGGKREGAGRKGINDGQKRKKHSVYCSDDELIKLRAYLATIRGGVKVESIMENKNDPVNHPSHYTDGKIEVIDFIDDKKLGFCLGNAVKYISRAGKKDPTKRIEDLQKAVWYIEWQITKWAKENI